MATAGRDEKFYVPSLDGIRAVAFMMVFVAHSGLEKYVPGGFGVTIFFFLSGYIITTLLRLEYIQNNSISLRNFYLRRAYRIFPPMYATLLFGIGLTVCGVFDNTMSVIGVAAQSLHLTNYYRIYGDTSQMVPYTGIYWSLAIEEHFYLIYPLLLISLIRVKSFSKIALALLGICALVLLWRCILVYGLQVERLRTYVGSDTRADSLLFGCILGFWGNPMFEKNRILHYHGNSILQAIVLSLCLAVLLFSLLFRNEGFRETFRYSLQGLALFPVFYYAICNARWPLFRWLEYSSVRWIGRLSYTLYLCHQMMIGVVSEIQGNDSDGIWKSLVALALSLLYAVAMFKFVERPFARLRTKLHREAITHTEPVSVPAHS